MEELYQKLIDDGILRKHNLRAYMKVAQMFETKNKVAIDHATGTGKSFISLQLMYDNQDKNIIFLVPREGIGTQIEEHINGLSPDAREKHFKNVKIMTTQSFIRLTREELKNLDVDLLITDEFHHYGSEVWGTKVKHLINTHPNLKVFGMTATPKRERGSSREEDMGETFFEGNIASRYSLADAIEEGVLQAPIYRGAIYKLDDQIDESIDKVEHSNLSVEEKRELLEKLKLAKKRVQEADSFNEIVKKNIKKGGKYIVFCPQKNEDMESVIESSYSWFKDFIDESEITRYQVRSKNSKRINKINSDAFYNDKEQGKLKLMFAMDMYNEGIHVPDIDGVIMLRPTQSDIIFYQQLGRALAAGGSNKRPLVLDFVNNYDYIRKLELKVKQKREVKERERKHSAGYSEEYNLDIVFDIAVENIDIQNMLFEINSKVDLSVEQKIEEYIEMLNQGETPAVPDKNTFSNGQLIGNFWYNNKEKIKEKLFNSERYAVGYELAKQHVEKWSNKLSVKEKIEEYIEMLNQGFIEIKWKDDENTFSNSDPIIQFWNDYKKRIKERLFTDEKYAVGYELANKKVENYFNKFENKKTSEMSVEQKIEEYIELLKQGETPTTLEKKMFTNGRPIKYFWKTYKERIRERLFKGEKYIIGYEPAKQIVKDYFNKYEEKKSNQLSFDQKIEEYIEMLNQGLIEIRAIDTKNTFSNGQLIGSFFSNNKEKIKKKLFTEEKYQDNYDSAKQIIIDKLGLDEEDIELNNGGKNL